MGKPYIPKPPVPANELPPLSVEMIMLEAWLESQIARAKPKRRARMIADLYGAAADLKALGNVRRIRSLDRPAELCFAEKRRQAGVALHTIADLFHDAS